MTVAVGKVPPPGGLAGRRIVNAWAERSRVGSRGAASWIVEEEKGRGACSSLGGCRRKAVFCSVA